MFHLAPPVGLSSSRSRKANRDWHAPLQSAVLTAIENAIAAATATTVVASDVSSSERIFVNGDAESRELLRAFDAFLAHGYAPFFLLHFRMRVVGRHVFADFPARQNAIGCAFESSCRATSVVDSRSSGARDRSAYFPSPG